MKAELHSHSHYSKGKKVIVEGFHSPEEMLRHAQKTGLEVLSVTDHETFKGSEQALRLEKKFDVLVLPGQELKCEKGHLLAYGLQEEIQSNLSLEESIDLIHQQGGIAVAPHPFDLATCKNDPPAVPISKIVPLIGDSLSTISKHCSKVFSRAVACETNCSSVPEL